LTRDGILIVVKDNAQQLREELTDEELRNFTDQKYLDHLARKKLGVGVGTHKNHDALLTATT